MKTIFTTADLPVEGFYPSNWNIEELENRAAEVNKHYPCELWHIFSQENEKLVYEHSEIILLVPSCPLKITTDYGQYQKRWSIMSNIQSVFIEYSYNDINYYKRDIPQPNYIGVLSTKKIQAWVDYHLAVYNAVLPHYVAATAELVNFRLSLEGLDVNWYNKGNSGEIILNGIKFRFDINGLHITKKMEIHSSVATSIGNFLRLANNGLATGQDKN